MNETMIQEDWIVKSWTELMIDQIKYNLNKEWTENRTE